MSAVGQKVRSPWAWGVGGVLVLALGLRLWGIGFGLPHLYHFDEMFYVVAALWLGKGVLLTPPHAPTGLSNVLFGEYGLYYLVGRLTGTFPSTQAFEVAYRADPTVFYLLDRLTVALLGAATVLAVYGLGKALSGRLPGLLAAGLLAVSFLHVRDSHYGVPDVPMTLLVTAAVALAAMAVGSGRRSLLYGAGLAGGLAVALKWTALPILLPVGWAAWCTAGAEGRRGLRRLLARPMVLAAACLAFGFVAGSPQILLAPGPFLKYALAEWQAGDKGGFGTWQVDALPGWLFYLKTLAWGLGPAMLVLAVAGGLRRLALAARRRDPMSILVLAFPVAYYLGMGATRHYFARYALPLAPFAALFAAEAIEAGARWLGASRPRVRWALAGLLVVGAAVPTLVSGLRSDYLLTQEDTRTSAKQWIEAHLPEGSKIAVDWTVHGPPLASPTNPLPRSSRLYDVHILEGTGLADHPLAWYREQGFDYLVASSSIYRLRLVDTVRDAERQAFYAALDLELEPVQQFRASPGEEELPFIFDEIYGPAVGLWQRERPGPTIKIYRVGGS